MSQSISHKLTRRSTQQAETTDQKIIHESEVLASVIQTYYEIQRATFFADVEWESEESWKDETEKEADDWDEIEEDRFYTSPLQGR